MKPNVYVVLMDFACFMLIMAALVSKSPSIEVLWMVAAAHGANVTYLRWAITKAALKEPEDGR